MFKHFNALLTQALPTARSSPVCHRSLGLAISILSTGPSTPPVLSSAGASARVTPTLAHACKNVYANAVYANISTYQQDIMLFLTF